MTFRAYDTPKCHNEDFYLAREPAHHILQAGYHRSRLLLAKSLAVRILESNPEVQSVGDFGCGTGGLLNELKSEFPNLIYHGYDMSPQAVEFGRANYGLDLWLCDYTAKSDVEFPTYQHLCKTRLEILYPDLLLMTETLEHLIDPHTFVYWLPHTTMKYVVASVPDYEGPGNVMDCHLWAWTGESFPNMFADAGMEVIGYTHESMTQFVVARNLKL